MCWRKALPSLSLHLTEIRGVLIAFAALLLLAILDAVLSADGRLRDLEKPARMLFAASAMVAVVACHPNRKALWWGLIAGCIAGAVFIAYQRWGLGVDRPGGLINSITFGDIILCMGLLCLAGMLDFSGRSAIWPGLGALAGLFGSIATGTRGGWIAVVLCLLLFLRHGHILRGRLRKGIALLGLALLVATYFIPQTGARERVDQGISDVRQYMNGGDAYTNIGVRLELWRGAASLIERHPLLGTSQAGARAELEQLVADGVVQPFVLEIEHFHNDMLQVLVYGGAVGLLVWLSTLLAPFLFFLRQMRHPRAAAPAMAGMLLVLSYFSFGLTEVIFYSVRSTMFYVLMLFILMGMCLNARPAGTSPPNR
ncbi:MAG: O-antigen ligase family protein [Duganella sp.]